MEYKKVSIIIPLYNCEEYVRSCMQGIFDQTYPSEKYEVIVVDNNSTDKSVDIVKEFNVTLISLPYGNISKVRNHGASFASGEIMGFVDSDCIIAKDWIRNAMEILKKSDVGVVGTGYIVPPSGASWVEKAWLVEPKTAFRYVDFVPSGNFIIKSRVFKEVQGFNENLETCEDADICERITKRGYKIVNSNNIQSIHLRNFKTIYQMFLKEMWYGKTMMVSLRNNPFDKVFIFTILFLFLHIISTVALFFTNWFLLSCSIIFILILIFSATTNRVIISHKYSLFFHTALLYYIYFLARSFAILINFKANIRSMRIFGKRKDN
ncbi:MAG: glycosyltransferase [Planctomycetota bacterium]|jgi:glycosyltransferase involved in cell wall biosynthesis